MTLLESIEDYLRYIKHEQGVSKTTYKSYHAYLGAFVRFLTENGYPAPSLTDFNPATVKRFYYSITGNGLRPRSLYGYIIPLRSFGNYLVDHKVITDSPAHTIRLPKKDAAIRQETSEDECAALLEFVERQRNPSKVAFQRAVMATLIYTGLRRAEVCDLLLADVTLSETGSWILVRCGKGSKSRKVPLCTEAQDALREWVAVRPTDAAHPYLFSIGKRRRMYFQGIRSVVEEVKALAGFSDRSHISPHSIRHLCASRLMRQGASLHEVMTWLGHSQISTTQRYLHTSQEDLHNIAHLASPQARTIPAPTEYQATTVRVVRRMQR